MFAKRIPKHKEATKGRFQERARMVNSQEHVSAVEKQERATSKQGTKAMLLAKAREMENAREQAKIERLDKIRELARAELRVTSAMLRDMDQPPPTAKELQRQRRMEKFREIFTFVRFEDDTPIFYSVVGKETLTNERLMEYKKDLQAMESRRNQVLEEDKKQELEDFWNDRDKRCNQNCINEKSFYDYNLKKIKENQDLQQVQRQQAKEERDQAMRHREMFAQEVKNEEQRKGISKKKLFKEIQEDIMDKSKHRELLAQNDMVAEQKARYVQLDLDEKERQKKLEHIRRLQDHQMLVDVVSDKYAVVMLRQANSPTWRNKVQLFKD